MLLNKTIRNLTNLALAIALLLNFAGLTGASDVDFEKANTVLTKYCAGCHNSDEANGDFSLESFDAILKGGESGNSLTPGSAASSRLVQMMLSRLEPKMPPEDEAQPTQDEIQIVMDWIDAGANGPNGPNGPNGVAGLATKISSPKIKSSVGFSPVTALALSADESVLAVGRFGRIEFRSQANDSIQGTIEDLPGKVTSLAFTGDGKRIFAATGVAGLFGEAIEIDVLERTIKRRFRGHKDLVYTLALNKDEDLLVSGGYDRKAIVWNLKTGKPVQELRGHNGSIFDAKFDPSSRIIATASADATVKIWQVSDGQRLDTRSEPLKEQNTIAFSHDGKFVFGAGEDNRIRKWELVSFNESKINPLQISRFAHDAPIDEIQIDPTGKWLVSVSQDRLVKIWDSKTLQEAFVFPEQSANVQAIAVGKSRLIMGRMDGSLQSFPWPSLENPQLIASSANDGAPASGAQMEFEPREEEIAEEQEPNDDIARANELSVPFKFNGVINADDHTDVDLVKFTAKAGEVWIFETKAARDKSPIDTHISILDSEGDSVPRVILQAVRDSYFTFRGKNSTQADDFRVFNWEEMRIGQLLYCNGEVVRLFHYPRGPDSGFNLFPNFGSRHTLFDTTPLAHALNEPCYIVEALPPNSELIETGLPRFLVNYENDDDGQQLIGKDSRLTFTAPASGEYYVRVSDARDFQGTDFKYELSSRRPQPSFAINKVNGENPKIAKGTFKRIGVDIDRLDGFEGEVTVSIEGLPVGFSAFGETTVEPMQSRAWFVIKADADAEIAPVAPKQEKCGQSADDTDGAKSDTAKSGGAKADEAKPGRADNDSEGNDSAQIVLTATILGKETRKTKSLGKIELDANTKLTVRLHGNASSDSSGLDLPVIEIRPGQTIQAKISVQRLKHKARINFGKQDAAFNTPFGVFVNNTGLNGVLIPPGETEREFTLTAEPMVQPCERLIFVESEEAGRPCSNPAILRVLPR